MSDSHSHHVMPFSTYIAVFSALIFLTIITVWVAQFDFGMFNGVVAMSIATVKAAFVALYFMQLKQDNKLYLVMLVSSVGFLLLLWGFTFFDFITRVGEASTL